MRRLTAMVPISANKGVNNNSASRAFFMKVRPNTLWGRMASIRLYSASIMRHRPSRRENKQHKNPGQHSGQRHFALIGDIATAFAGLLSSPPTSAFFRLTLALISPISGTETEWLPTFAGQAGFHILLSHHP